jgi:hypothetical protein
MSTHKHLSAIRPLLLLFDLAVLTVKHIPPLTLAFLFDLHVSLRFGCAIGTRHSSPVVRPSIRGIPGISPSRFVVVERIVAILVEVAAPVGVLILGLGRNAYGLGRIAGLVVHPLGRRVGVGCFG